jgi:hypothetical protein
MAVYKVKLIQEMKIHSDSEDHAYELAMERVFEDGFEPTDSEVTKIEDKD